MRISYPISGQIKRNYARRFDERVGKSLYVHLGTKTTYDEIYTDATINKSSIILLFLVAT